MFGEEGELRAKHKNMELYFLPIAVSATDSTTVNIHPTVFTWAFHRATIHPLRPILPSSTSGRLLMVVDIHSDGLLVGLWHWFCRGDSCGLWVTYWSDEWWRGWIYCKILKLEQKQCLKYFLSLWNFVGFKFHDNCCLSFSMPATIDASCLKSNYCFVCKGK